MLSHVAHGVFSSAMKVGYIKFLSHTVLAIALRNITASWFCAMSLH
jgi:hypothetical protein